MLHVLEWEMLRLMCVCVWSLSLSHTLSLLQVKHVFWYDTTNLRWVRERVRERERKMYLSPFIKNCGIGLIMGRKWIRVTQYSFCNKHLLLKLESSRKVVCNNFLFDDANSKCITNSASQPASPPTNHFLTSNYNFQILTSCTSHIAQMVEQKIVTW